MVIIIGALMLSVILYVILSEGVLLDDLPSFIISFGLAMVIISLGLFCPFSGYEEPEIEQIELSSITENAEHPYYLIISNDEKYIYKTSEIINKYGVSEKVIEVLNKNTVAVYEEEREDAILQKYVYKGKISGFTFAIGAKKTEYVFFVPQGTIIK